MNVRVRMFALARQLFGDAEIELQLPERASVRDVRALLAERFPDAAALLANSLIAVDARYAADDTPISPQNEIAVIPPVSGG